MQTKLSNTASARSFPERWLLHCTAVILLCRQQHAMPVQTTRAPLNSQYHRAPAGMDEVRVSRDMASTELERTTRCEGEGMSTGTLWLASDGPLLLEDSGDMGRGGGARPRVGGPSAPLLVVLGAGATSGAGGAAAAGTAAGVEAGRGGGEARAREGGAPSACPGSDAGWLPTLSGMEDAEEREARLAELPSGRRTICRCSSREGRREPVELEDSTSKEAGRGTPCAAATAAGRGSGEGLRAGGGTSAATAAAAAAAAAARAAG